jgi:histidine triad (HIT) family protein
VARDPDCVFCKIIAGEIPAAGVAESDLAIAFMDIGPIAEGHTLVIPRDHYETVMDMPPEVVADVYGLAARVARAIKASMGCEGLNVLQNNGACAGQVVGHVHVHVIPRDSGDGIAWPWPSTEAEPDRLASLAERIKSGMNEA